jgi:hypothetical protein
MVPVLATDGWMDEEDLSGLLGARTRPELHGRTAMYVCILCGDLGCGAYTALVEVEGDKVVWRDFGNQNDREPFEQYDIISGVGPFTFDRGAYTTLLSQYRSSVGHPPQAQGDGQR